MWINSFNSVKGISNGKFQSRGSKFFAYLFPMNELSELEAIISELKKEHVKARHFCYAYRALQGSEITEYGSDAGEPSGSAGTPILAELKSSELLNTGCVVVRYFGGTKLGVPGLIEAYRTSCAEAVKEARRIVYRRVLQYRLDMPMSLQPHLLTASKQMNLDIEDDVYTDRYSTTISIPRSLEGGGLDQVLRRLSDRDYDNMDDQLAYLDINVSPLGEGIKEGS